MKMILMKVTFLSFVCLLSCAKKNHEDEIKINRQEYNDSGEEKYSDKENNAAGKNPVLKRITSADVKTHVGDSVIVKGYVADIYLSDKVAYINFGGKFPKNDFACAVFSKKFDELGDLSVFKNRDVEVTGKISSYKGRAQIIIERKDQLKIIDQ